MALRRQTGHDTFWSINIIDYRQIKSYLATLTILGYTVGAETNVIGQTARAGDDRRNLDCPDRVY